MKHLNTCLASSGQKKHWLITASILLCSLLYGYGQKGIFKGIVIDGVTQRAISGVALLNERTGRLLATTAVDGAYNIALDKGDYTINYKLAGFQQNIVSRIIISDRKFCYLTVVLYPIATAGNTGPKKHFDTGTISAADSVLRTIYSTAYATGYRARNALPHDIGSGLQLWSVNPGNYKNGEMVVNGIAGVIPQSNQSSPALQSFTISGMGGRYQQLLYNGAVFNNFDPLQRSYPLALLPSEAIATAGVQKTGNGQLPADFAGGTISITTKDQSDNDFFYIRGGAGITANTTGNNFYNEKRSSLEFLGLPGSQRSLPGQFPTTRSQFPLSSKNIQEQVRLSSLLTNNAAPANTGNASPDEKFTIGFGKNYKLKKSGALISITGFADQARERQFNESFSQVAPNIAQNPWPFTVTGQPLITAQSKDSNYTYTSHLSAVLNASIVYRRNKISFRNFAGSLFTNTYINKSGVYKPDEDTMAHNAIHIAGTQTHFLNSQLAGEHALGENNQLKLDWQFTYNYLNVQNPDERNLLLRKDAAGKALYEIATPMNAGGFTNTGRLWRKSKDHNFSGTVNLSFPFKLLQHTQVLSGGIAIQQQYRLFNADLLFTQGPGYVPTDKLLAPERYYPGGLTVASYYINGYANPTTIQPAYRGNYTASSSLGAAYFQLDTRISQAIALRLSARAETDNQLASNIYYNYSTGFKNPQQIALDENTRIAGFYFLPSASLVYSPVKQLQLSGAYFKSLNRPQLQELSMYTYYDAGSFMVKTGNPLLATASIDNYNAGIKLLPNPFSTLSVTAFYKKINQPIEYIVSNYNNGTMLLTPHNTPSAEVKGLDASLNIKLNFINNPWASGISVFAGGNITSSTAAAGPVRSSATPMVTQHALSGSPDYAVNAGFLLQYPRFPQVTVQYNRTGDYLAALGSGTVYALANGNKVAAVPDYRIAGRDQLDIQVAQQLFHSKLQVIAGINNLTASAHTTYQDLNGNKKFDGPLSLKNNGNSGGFYMSGTDNAVFSISSQRIYHLTLSYLFY